MRPDSAYILGIDIGSATVKMAQLDEVGNLLNQSYRLHYGKVYDTLVEMCDGFQLNHNQYIVSPSSGNWLNASVTKYDPQISVIAATKHFFPDVRSILYVGAGSFQLIQLDEDGQYQMAVSNTSCAAGTGSFLDQQAYRLNLSGVEELVEMASANNGTLPSIASRCAVFAKTDLIHAQQKGYSREAICDSLCRGLAKNMVDSLFGDSIPIGKMVFAGGVARNKAVKGHLEDLLGIELVTNEWVHLFGAIGSALIHQEEIDIDKKGIMIDDVREVINPTKVNRDYVNKPLSLELSDYPEFTSRESYDYMPSIVQHKKCIQVEIYKDLNGIKTIPSYIGIDIGSTSTKAMITDVYGKAVAGFYTYTCGDPMMATRAIFESINQLEQDKAIGFEIKAAGTTGSGRKFVGTIIDADLIVDEITAHAKAAFRLNPQTDTIIEIGGQDAKFTMMSKGSVTFTQMNSVCAAGTGSFIEEQAEKLGVSLYDYSELAEGVSSPLASDRCTVYMERDINHYFNCGYNLREILASVLYSVRDNYLHKVAVESAIGKQICFQGATARNKALVAAFEQKLNKKIFVSRFCHLTGALGTAIMLSDGQYSGNAFDGIDLYKHKIPVTTEACDFCNNECRIQLANVKGQKVAYGFMCGRDYGTEKYINKNSSGFDLYKSRSKVISASKTVSKNLNCSIGIPAALHLFDEQNLWKRFFQELGFNTRTSSSYMQAVQDGKRIAGAEFCAPMQAMYGHVTWLADRTDYIFLPVYLQSRNAQNGVESSYCYYTQFAPSVVSLVNNGIKKKSLTPLLDFTKGQNHIINILTYEINKIASQKFKKSDVRKAYRIAVNAYENSQQELKELYVEEIRNTKNISVVLIGRPYLVLSKSINKGIPEIFSGMGIKTFYQDMVPYEQDDLLDIDYMLRTLPWSYATRILEVCRVIAETPNVYPVFMTAFKCSPDSFVLEYARQLLDQKAKPYLILQLDEHDSNVGYETRIEAGIRSFRNHQNKKGSRIELQKPLLTKPTRKLQNGKTLLFPNYDDISGRFLVANLCRAGYDVRLLPQDEQSMKRSMAHNTGQCLPLNIIAQSCIDYIDNHNLNPADTMLWLAECFVSCNVKMYPHYIKTIFEKHGHGMENTSVYLGALSHLEISVKTCIRAYFCYMLGGLLRRLVTKLRPYEVVPGETNQALAHSIEHIEKAFHGRDSLDNALRFAMKHFEEIECIDEQRPKVAIFGDLFVRDNDVMNQQLFSTIEKAGGEVINTPYHEYVKITVENAIRRRVAMGRRLEAISIKALISILDVLDKGYYNYFEPFLGPKSEIDAKKLEKNLEFFNIKSLHGGESYENILKIFHLLNKYPDISLFVQTNPAYCCPSLVTEAMKDEIFRQTGIPIVTLTYDSTSEQKNDILLPYIHSLKKKMSGKKTGKFYHAENS
jgi:predicted CoA-substrate-specific enzyme activase